MPDQMAAMLEQKLSTPKLVRPLRLVPPTAATIHALHYHMVDVMTVQKS